MFIKEALGLLFFGKNSESKKENSRQLPVEVWLKIFGYLSPIDLSRTSLVCKEWQQLASDETLWQAICKNLGLERIDTLREFSWRDYYLETQGEMYASFEKGMVVKRKPSISYVKTEIDQNYLAEQITTKGSRSLSGSLRVQCNRREEYSLWSAYHRTSPTAYFPDDKVSEPFVNINLRNSNEIFRFDLPPEGHVRGLALENNVLAIHTETAGKEDTATCTLYLLNIKKMLESDEVSKKRAASQNANPGRTEIHRLDFSQMIEYTSTHIFHDKLTPYCCGKFLYCSAWVGYGFYIFAETGPLEESQTRIFQEWNFSS